MLHLAPVDGETWPRNVLWLPWAPATARIFLYVTELITVLCAQVAAAILPEEPVSSATRAYSDDLRGAARPPSTSSAVAIVPEPRWRRQWKDWQEKVGTPCTRSQLDFNPLLKDLSHEKLLPRGWALSVFKCTLYYIA